MKILERGGRWRWDIRSEAGCEKGRAEGSFTAVHTQGLGSLDTGEPRVVVHTQEAMAVASLMGYVVRPSQNETNSREGVPPVGQQGMQEPREEGVGGRGVHSKGKMV